MWFQVDKLSRMGRELIGIFPYKLRNFTISGKALHGLSLNNIFQVRVYDLREYINLVAYYKCFNYINRKLFLGSEISKFEFDNFQYELGNNIE